MTLGLGTIVECDSIPKGTVENNLYYLWPVSSKIVKVFANHHISRTLLAFDGVTNAHESQPTADHNGRAMSLCFKLFYLRVRLE